MPVRSVGFICRLNMVVKFLEFSNLYLVGDNIIVHQLADALMQLLLLLFIVAI